MTGDMAAETRTAETKAAETQVYRVYIKATPQRVWDAITRPEWTDRYGYGGKTDYDFTPGAQYGTRPSDAMIKVSADNGWPLPEVILDGEVVEAEPPHRLVVTWRMLMDPQLAAEGFTRVTYEIAEAAGATRLTVTHELAGAPRLALVVAGTNEAEGAGGGWSWVLSDLKSLLETGSPLAG